MEREVQDIKIYGKSGQRGRTLKCRLEIDLIQIQTKKEKQRRAKKGKKSGLKIEEDKKKKEARKGGRVKF